MSRPNRSVPEPCPFEFTKSFPIIRTMEGRLEQARERVQAAEAELSEKARPVLQKIAEVCAKAGAFARDKNEYTVEIATIGPRAHEVSAFCNGAFAEPVGDFHLGTYVSTCMSNGRYNAVHLRIKRSSMHNAPVPAAVAVWSKILEVVRARCAAAEADMRGAAQCLIYELFVAALSKNDAAFNVVFDLHDANRNAFVAAFIRRVHETLYWPESLHYKEQMFAQVLDEFKHDMAKAQWRVEWSVEHGVYTITAEPASAPAEPARPRRNKRAA